MALLEVSQLRKTYNGTVAVDEIGFQVAAGEIFGLLGPNGAGKTTTMMMIAGLIQPDAGSIQLNGQVSQAGNRRMKRILGVVPQELALYPELTAEENLRFFGRLYGFRGQRLQGQIALALAQTGLEEQAHSRVETFSGGMKRRLNFGVALVHRPQLLILDEPTVGVDPQSRSHLLDCVRQAAAGGVAVLYASHYMEEVQAICHRVGILDHGRMLACDNLHRLLSSMETELRLRVAGLAPADADALAGLAHMESQDAEETILRVSRNTGQSLQETLLTILERLRKANAELRAIDTEEPNLERLFLQMTGAHLRD